MHALTLNQQCPNFTIPFFLKTASLKIELAKGICSTGPETCFKQFLLPLQLGIEMVVFLCNSVVRSSMNKETPQFLNAVTNAQFPVISKIHQITFVTIERKYKTEVSNKGKE